MRRKWVASGFSVTGRFAAGVPCVIVVVIGWSVVALVVEVKWIRVIGCRNLPGHSPQMSLMISFVVAGSCMCRLKVRGGSRGMVTVRRMVFCVGCVVVCCLGVCVCGVCEGLLLCVRVCSSLPCGVGNCRRGLGKFRCCSSWFVVSDNK